MKIITNLISLRVVIATVLSFSLLVFPLRPTSARTPRPAADLKSESQFRSEASRYDGAIRSIGGIVTMGLEIPNDLKKVIEILKRERPNLKFHFSKLVILALSDSTFTNALKKKAPDKRAAEALLKDLNANRNAVLKLDGAESLRTRMQRSVEADAATLRRAAERLREAAEKIKKGTQGSTAPGFSPTEELKLIRINFDTERQRETLADATLILHQDPVTLVIGSILLALFVATVLYLVALPIALTITNLIVVEEPDEYAECVRRVDERFAACISDAEAQPFPLNLVAIALCDAKWLQEMATCLLSY